MKTIAFVSFCALAASALPFSARVAREREALRQGVPSVEAASDDAVEPGLVAWHPSFAAACERAQETGKPVLLFQLIGRLDQRFC